VPRKLLFYLQVIFMICLFSLLTILTHKKKESSLYIWVSW